MSTFVYHIVYSTSPAKQNMLTDQVFGHIDGKLYGAPTRTRTADLLITNPRHLTFMPKSPVASIQIHSGPLVTAIIHIL